MVIYRISVAATLKVYDKYWFGLSGQTSILATATAALIDLIIILLLNKINPPGMINYICMYHKGRLSPYRKKVVKR